MAYLDTELKTTLAFAVAAIIVGYISFLFNSTLAAAGFAVVIFIALHFALKKALKIKEDKKWWTTMGIVYFILWLVVWTVFYNYALL